MENSFYILCLVWLICVTVMIPQARGEMCSVVTRAKSVNNLSMLRKKAFDAFNAECRMKKNHQILKSVWNVRTEYDQTIFNPEAVSVPFKINFTVKTRRDAIIFLKENLETDSKYAQTVIGGWGNTRSYITDDTVCNLNYNYETGLVSEVQTRPFWIEFKDGILTFGKGGSETGFMVWDARACWQRVPQAVYIGVSSWEEPGDWQVYFPRNP